MKVVVCVKQVPDSWAQKSLREVDSTLDRAAADRVLNDLDEYAVEEALRIQEAHGGPEAVEIVVLSMGPVEAVDSIRKALQMGADSGVHITDEALHGTDAMGTSAVLAAAVTAESPDIVMFGIESTDAKMSVIPAMIAERLSLPQLTAAQKVDVDPSAGTARIERQTAQGHEVVEAALPVLISVVEKINEPRYPSFKGIMAAKKKPIETRGLADLGIDASSVGLAHAWTQVDSFAARPPKAKGTIVTDEGEGGSRIAAFLVEQKLI
jgi:electron transfer flavoprotein beta subunit